jgi:hypothetical protein
MRVAAALGLASLLLASGCLDSKAPTRDESRPVDLAPFVNAIAVGHDHTDFDSHVLSNNVELIGHSYLGDNGPPGGLGEIDVVGNYAYVAVFNVGFAIVDLSDPAHPTLVSLTETPTPGLPVVGRYTADLKVDATGDWVFLAMELSETPGVLIYDARDKANPVFAGFWPAPGTLLGCHMVEYAVINEQEYLFCAPLDNAIWIGLLLPPTPTGQREVVQVGRWVPTTPKFVDQQLNSLQNNPVGYGPSLVSGHQDMTFQPDPLTGAPTLFVSFWNLGMRIVDVSNPLVPVEVGSWAGEDGELWRGNLHTTVAMESEGRRIIVTIPEATSPPALFVLDATDLNAPVLLAQWTALDDFQGEDGIFSLHNFQIVAGKVYIAMGHGGLWCLDISTPQKQAAPEPIASYLPHMPRPDGEPYQGYYWDSVLWNGYWLTADGSGGFYVLHKLGDPTGDGNYTSFA